MMIVVEIASRAGTRACKGIRRASYDYGQTSKCASRPLRFDATQPMSMSADVSLIAVVRRAGSFIVDR